MTTTTTMTTNQAVKPLSINQLRLSALNKINEVIFRYGFLLSVSFLVYLLTLLLIINRL